LVFNKIKAMKYAPSLPRGFIVSHKKNLVVRFIPALTREDYCVYFFCLKSLEDEIAKNRVKGTYGGWRLGGKIRSLENFDDVSSMPDNSYNRYAWRQAWTDYQTKAYQFYRNKTFKYFLVYDIANFYDSLKLDRLEKLVRGEVKRNKYQELNLLFYFLSNWNKKYLYYEQQSIGIPQDEVGDCSRILANFYLQNYDKYIFALAHKKHAGYLRYADDQILGARNEKDVKELMFRASEALARIGLNLNAHKAKCLNRRQFALYWSFDIFQLLTNPNNAKKILKAYIKFKRILKLEAEGKITLNSQAVLKRLRNCKIKKLPKSACRDIIKIAQEESFILNCNSFYLGQIYSLLGTKATIKFIIRLNDLATKVLYNQYHLRVLRFAKEKRLPSRRFLKVEKCLKKLNVLDLKILDKIS